MASSQLRKTQYPTSWLNLLRHLRHLLVAEQPDLLLHQAEPLLHEEDGLREGGQLAVHALELPDHLGQALLLLGPPVLLFLAPPELLSQVPVGRLYRLVHRHLGHPLPGQGGAPHGVVWRVVVVVVVVVDGAGGLIQIIICGVGLTTVQ